MKNNVKIAVFVFSLFVFLGLLPERICASVYPLPAPGNDLVGKTEVIEADGKEDLQMIGRRYDLGYFEMVEANQHLPKQGLIPKHSKVTLPGQFILPKYRHGVVINIAELRLFYFPEHSQEVRTYPIGVGRMGWITPVGQTKIVKKKEKPTWIAPKSIQKAAAAEGRIIPDMILPGPDNPLGEYSLRLAFSEPYLIHGTNDPTGVGRRSSAGCVRMFPEDIKDLFFKTEVGTQVTIVNEPYKAGWQNAELYLEVHQPLQEDQVTYVQQPSLTRMVQTVLDVERSTSDEVDWELAENVAREEGGVPIVIGRHRS